MTDDEREGILMDAQRAVEKARRDLMFGRAWRASASKAAALIGAAVLGV